MTALAETFTKPFLDRLLVSLIPFFLNLTDDITEARREALATLEAYGARTRAELIQATRILTLNFTVTKMLTEAEVCGHLSDNFKQRLRDSAMKMTKTALSDEKALTERLKRDVPAGADLTAHPKARTAQPQAGERQAPGTPIQPAPKAQPTQAQAAEPIDDLIDEVAQEVLDAVNAQIQAFSNRTTINRPTGSPPVPEPKPRNDVPRPMGKEMGDIRAWPRRPGDAAPAVPA